MDAAGFRRMRREPRHRAAVVHAPTVFAFKVLPHISPVQAGIGTHSGVTAGVGIVVVDTK